MSDTSQWPTIAQAAATLQVSTKTLERKIKAGEIEAQHRPRGRETGSAKRGIRPATVVNPHDIERLKPPAFVLPPSQLSNEVLVPASEKIPGPSALDLLAAIARVPNQAHAPAWVGIEAAAEVSGLSAAFLKRAAKAGSIVAVRDKRQWKFQRDALLTWTPGTK